MQVKSPDTINSASTASYTLKPVNLCMTETAMPLAASLTAGCVKAAQKQLAPQKP